MIARHLTVATSLFTPPELSSGSDSVPTAPSTAHSLQGVCGLLTVPEWGIAHADTCTVSRRHALSSVEEVKAYINLELHRTSPVPDQPVTLGPKIAPVCFEFWLSTTIIAAAKEIQEPLRLGQIALNIARLVNIARPLNIFPDRDFLARALKVFANSVSTVPGKLPSIPFSQPLSLTPLAPATPLNLTSDASRAVCNAFFGHVLFAIPVSSDVSETNVFSFLRSSCEAANLSVVPSTWHKPLVDRFAFDRDLANAIAAERDHADPTHNDVEVGVGRLVNLRTLLIGPEPTALLASTLREFVAMEFKFEQPAQTADADDALATVYYGVQVHHSLFTPPELSSGSDSVPTAPSTAHSLQGVCGLLTVPEWGIAHADTCTVSRRHALSSVEEVKAYINLELHRTSPVPDQPVTLGPKIAPVCFEFWLSTTIIAAAKEIQEPLRLGQIALNIARLVNIARPLNIFPDRDFLARALKVFANSVSTVPGKLPSIPFSQPLSLTPLAPATPLNLTSDASRAVCNAFFGHVLFAIPVSSDVSETNVFSFLRSSCEAANLSVVPSTWHKPLVDRFAFDRDLANAIAAERDHADPTHNDVEVGVGRLVNLRTLLIGPEPTALLASTLREFDSVVQAFFCCSSLFSRAPPTFDCLAKVLARSGSKATLAGGSR